MGEAQRHYNVPVSEATKLHIGDPVVVPTFPNIERKPDGTVIVTEEDGSVFIGEEWAYHHKPGDPLPPHITAAFETMKNSTYAERLRQRYSGTGVQVIEGLGGCANDRHPPAGTPPSERHLADRDRPRTEQH